MQACSLLPILPPPPGTSLRHLEIPMDLTTMRLPDWVNNIRDLATEDGHVATHLCGDWDGDTIIHTFRTHKECPESNLAGFASIHTLCVDVAR